jgi:hypothetical protein
LLFFSLVACKDKIFTGNVNCDECYTDGYDSIDIVLNVSINDQFLEVPVLLYKGKSIENGEFIDTFYCFIDEEKVVYNTVFVKSDESYSAKAIYKNNDRTVFVVDGINQKMKRVSDVCEQECWVSVNDELSLELVY